MNQQGMKLQLNQLNQLVQIVDCKLYNYLGRCSLTKPLPLPSFPYACYSFRISSYFVCVKTQMSILIHL